MELRQEKADSGPIITGIEGDSFKVDHVVREGALLLTPKSLNPWNVNADDALTGLADLVRDLNVDPLPEMLLLGTGARLVRPAMAEQAGLEDMGVGLEVVDSRTAARIWGLLRAEGRWVVAAILPPNA